jgi:hypothetical protein
VNLYLLKFESGETQFVEGESFEDALEVYHDANDPEKSPALESITLAEEGEDVPPVLRRPPEPPPPALESITLAEEGEDVPPVLRRPPEPPPPPPPPSEGALAVACSELVRVGNIVGYLLALGPGAPILEEFRARTDSPKPGDLVVEVSSLRGNTSDRIGWLVSRLGHGDWIVRELASGLEQTWTNSRWISLEVLGRRALKPSPSE